MKGLLESQRRISKTHSFLVLGEDSIFGLEGSLKDQMRRVNIYVIRSVKNLTVLKLSPHSKTTLAFKIASLNSKG